MGRALFSTVYSQTTAPAIREEPEALPSDMPAYATWRHHKFDPDSDDFFLNAEYEAFIPDAAGFQEQEDQQDQLSEQAEGDSPMAMGEDPASYIPRRPLRWDDRDGIYSVPNQQGGSWRIVGNVARNIPADSNSNDMVRPIPSDEANRLLLERARANVAPPAPPAPVRHVIETPQADVSAPREESSRPYMPPLSMPIPIPRGSSPASSGSDSPSPPPTTPPQAYSLGSFGTPSQLMSVSMSPPPTVSPRLYSWAMNRHVGSPGSPSVNRGPLTNPTARASYSRLAAPSPALRAQNVAL